jgi:hypothetical protein
VYQRRPGPGFGFQLVRKNKKVDKSKYVFYYTFCFDRTPERLEKIESLLKAGQNPNRMKYPPHELAWLFSNPLWLVTGDYKTSELLIRYGANVKKRPYIARAMNTVIISDRYPDESLGEGRKSVKYEKKLYELVKLYLEAGADPNFKGTATSELLLIPTDFNYRRYFNKYGYRPINLAIEYSAFSLVDLLLEYGALLDEESFEYSRKATELSGNRDMENYVEQIWRRQQENKKQKKRW